MDYAKKRDSNHEQIATELRQLGFAVYDCASFGHGLPDLLVMARGIIYLVEVKATARSPFTAAEKKFHLVFGDAENLVTVTSAEEFVSRIASHGYL